MDNLVYLYAAYTVIWLIVFAYIYYLSRRQLALQREIEVLKRRLEEH
mgnify:CR=1 FL=1